MKLAEVTDSVDFVGSPEIARDVAAAHNRNSVYGTYGKRVVDIAFCILILPLALPLIAVLWVLTRRDGGPGFFGHTRIGRDGKPFRCWKIRTMVTDAETKLQEYLRDNPEAAAEWARDHKLANDPRITRLGRILRKTSLDELPQLWNVFLGEMSVVGPRPIVVAELEKYGIHQTGYKSMKPGLTGLWQVSGRNDVTYEERVMLDMSYLVRMSLWLDAKIVLMTASAVLAKTGK